MMDQTVLQSQVIELITKLYRESPAFQPDKPITRETAIIRDLEFDSLMLVVLQIEVEDTFQIRFDFVSEDIQKTFSSVGALCDSVWNYVNHGI